MTTAEYLGLTAQGWRTMVKNWWDLALGGVLLGSALMGASFVVYMLFRKFQKSRQGGRNQEIPRTVSRCLQDIKSNTLPLCPPSETPKEPKSFGAFCGSFSIPPTPSQTSLLSKWDVIVLDPLQAGVLDALASSQCASSVVLGRLDVGKLLASDNKGSGSSDVVRKLGIVTRALVQSFKRPQDMHSHFTGVLMANWEAEFTPIVTNELVNYICAIGLDVYLEVSPPKFLNEKECRELNMEPVKGMICRNGAILANGERRNYFQMAEMREAMRALAAQSMTIASTVFMWDTIDDDVVLEHAVIKRSYTWCNFTSALSWIGSKSALFDAEVAMTRTVEAEPLGAMMWLKQDDIMKSHEIWRGNDRITKRESSDHVIYNSLDDFIPDLREKLSLATPREQGRGKNQSEEHDWPWRIHPAPSNPPQFSSHGLDATELGCYQLGLHCSTDEYADMVQQQGRLRDLNMLDCLKPEELRNIGEQLQDLYEQESLWASTPEESQAVKELMCLLTSNNGDDDDGLRVYVGLDSGFRTGASTRFCQFWGLYDYDVSTGIMNLYISGKTKDRTGTILHTFMASRECTRAQCFMAEIALAEQNESLDEDWELPKRLVQDIEQLTPAETILFLQRLGLSECEECPVLAARIRACCEFQLLEVPGLQQLKHLNAYTYLEGKISAEDLVKSRLEWYSEQSCDQPDPAAAISLFNEVEERVKHVLINCEDQIVTRIEIALTKILQKKQIDASADLFALSVFCAFRKLALEEVYMEINDRNPLPNPQSDQSACFAEMFALGSGCDAYFGMTPTAIGKLLTEKTQAYYRANQPPIRDDSSTELPTAYSSKLIDLDPQAGQKAPPFYYQVTFLGIFAIPAFIDIILLTTIGRGLYLTTYMSEIEKSMATTALMTSLFLCGAIGTWISSGGSYYLHSMAFSAMNMFIITRFLAGFAICITGGTVALIIIGVTKGFYAGFVFMIYFLLLNTYLTLLATLSIYQFPGFNFQSGRMIIINRIPLLIISPIVTLFVHKHDLLIYVSVMVVFVISLLFGARTMVSQWSTWYLKVHSITDIELVSWYTKNYASSSTSEKQSNITDLAATPIPRQTLLQDVLKEVNRGYFSKPTSDEVVLRLANGYDGTLFMMDWYCKYSRTKMPYPYSPTWNLQCKAAVQTLRDMQKGLKLHNAFVHWRNAGDELWGGVLYFVLALLDKWVALISGGSIVGLSDASSATFRLAVGFGLAYYLIGAVFLDGVAQPLWLLSQKNLAQPITSLEYLHQAALNDASAKRKLYWKNFMKFFFMHIWGLSFTSALMWAFDNSMDGTIMYLSYVGAYTGLLWYQYNRIFTGPLAFREPLLAVVIGLIVGIVLHVIFPNFPFSSVIALAVATWTAAILSAWRAHLGGPKPKKYDLGFKNSTVIHTSATLASDTVASQNALSETVDSICTLPEELRYRLDPSTHPGLEVMKLLTTREEGTQSKLVQDAFPSGDQLLFRIADLWKNGETIIDLVPMRHLIQQQEKTRAITRASGDRIHIFVFLGLDFVGDEWVMDIRRNCKVIAEAIIQSTLESRLGFSHDHSLLAELLVVNDNAEEGLSLPEGVKRQLQNSTSERQRVVKNGDKALLQYLLLGLDCDIYWDTLPKDIRSFLLKRACGESCQVSDKQLSWIASRFSGDTSLDIEVYVARCNLGATLTILINSFAGALESDYTHRDQPEPPDASYEKCIETTLSPATIDSDPRFIALIKGPISRVHHAFRHSIKFISVALVADPEFQRELNFVMKSKPAVIRWPVTLSLSAVWLFCKTLQQMVLPLLLFHGRDGITRLGRNMKGMKTVIQKDRIIVEGLSGPTTCFFTTHADGSSQLHQYEGIHEKDPGGLHKLMAVNTYSGKLVLRQREEYAKDALINLFTYEYHGGAGANDGKTMTSRLPMERQCIKGNLNGQLVFYDKRGYITSGSFIKDDNLVQFKFQYRKHAKFDDELLRAEYTLPHMSIQVAWCAPPARAPKTRLDKWIPYTKVTQATFTQGSQVYICKWHYEHKFHPVVTTTLNGQEVGTPAMIQHDWFGILQKPKNCSFVNENPLFAFKSVKTNVISRMLKLNTKWYPISTSRARTHLWKAWKTGKELDAVTARWLDEIILRKDKDMKPYWNARDLGRLDAGEKYLTAKADTVMARVDIDPDISSWTPLAFKLSDLLSFGQGGDSRINTRTQEAQMQDTDNELHILAMDTGTWPNEGGGVSACRRDMVNNLDTIRWHIVAENANDFGVPKFQIEKNVQSLTVLPLWGMDFLTPTHGIFQNCLDSSVQQKSHNTKDADIIKRFIPILTTLVKGSRAITIDRQMIAETTKALVDLNTYFESNRHWSDVWKSDVVKQAWRELWLTEDMPNCKPLSEWLDAEKPTLLHLDNALDMWHRYLFIFSIPVPEKIPDVFQASHHFAGASYGIVCKVKRNCTFHVWDHCISWREVTVFLSSSMSFDSPFVCNSLISLSKLASTLILHHADVVLPCADFFNPGWEVEIGTQENTIEHRKSYARKIDPVVNGICNMESFKPIEKIKSKVPTVTMLSHVRFVKDIKTAILAADIIVNLWGFSDYQLHIYGDMEKAPTYSVECQEIIASKSLRDNVILKGLGSPSKVLEDAWLFLNSSVSEGLPLAMGEAALTGVPVVCTDVGASFRVVTDPVTFKKFSAVVAPNDAVSLARAQVNVLGLLDEWSAFANDPPGYHPKLSLNPTREETAIIQKRMYEKQEERRKLGMMGRTNVLNSFSEGRYLREHEQMLWIGKYQAPSYRSRTVRPASNNSYSDGFKNADGYATSGMSSLRYPARGSRMSTLAGSSARSSLKEPIFNFREARGLSGTGSYASSVTVMER